MKLTRMTLNDADSVRFIVFIVLFHFYLFYS